MFSAAGVQVRKTVNGKQGPVLLEMSRILLTNKKQGNID
jgi:hypothetical protein